jgi:DnaJ-class molecular chaperone
MVYLILIGLTFLAFRLITRPFKNCRHCKGIGRLATRTGRGRPRPCRHCNGNGLRVRASTRIVGAIGHHVRAASDRETGRSISDIEDEF